MIDEKMHDLKDIPEPKKVVKSIYFLKKANAKSSELGSSTIEAEKPERKTNKNLRK